MLTRSCAPEGTQYCCEIKFIMILLRSPKMPLFLVWHTVRIPTSKNPPQSILFCIHNLYCCKPKFLRNEAHAVTPSSCQNLSWVALTRSGKKQSRWTPVDVEVTNYKAQEYQQPGGGNNPKLHVHLGQQAKLISSKWISPKWISPWVGEDQLWLVGSQREKTQGQLWG